MQKREYTPKEILQLNKNEIFVFGSNGKGFHGKGAAKIALDLFGAIYGQSKGLQGQSYAIITKKDWRKEKSSSLDEITDSIREFLDFAKQNIDKKFFVTKLGSSLAGYSTNEICDIFNKLRYLIPSNVILPKEYEVRDNDSRPTRGLLF